jgi:long-subunit acyl-CoA synthetase (AMP-forming)
MDLGWGCDACGKSIHPARNHFCCITCTEPLLDNTFDLCDECAPHHTTATHAISPPLASSYPLPANPRFADVLQKRLQESGYRKFVGSDLQGGKWKFTRYIDVYNQARSLASFLAKVLGATDEPQYMAISASNRAEWIIADFAVAFAGNVSVPIHTTTDTTLLAAILKHSNSQVLVCDRAQLDKLRQCFIELGALPVQHVVVMDDGVFTVEGDAFLLHSWHVATSLPPERWLAVRSARSGTELRTLLYTSGSTGAVSAA